MTAEVKEKLWNEFIKGGIGVLVMAIVIYFLYKDNKVANEDIRSEIKILRIETKECSKAYQDVLLNQVEKNTIELEKTHQALERVEQVFKSKRRY
jgi:hypothetical protein